MATNPRENSRGERMSGDISGRLGYVGETSPTLASARTNTGETSDSSSVHAKKRDLDGNKPKRELKRGTHFQRDLWTASVRGRDLPNNSFKKRRKKKEEKKHSRDLR